MRCSAIASWGGCVGAAVREQGVGKVGVPSGLLERMGTGRVRQPLGAVRAEGGRWVCAEASAGGRREWISRLGGYPLLHRFTSRHHSAPLPTRPNASVPDLCPQYPCQSGLKQRFCGFSRNGPKTSLRMSSRIEGKRAETSEERTRRTRWLAVWRR